MRFFENLITNLFPSILVEGTPWRADWEGTQRKRFIPAARYFFIVVALGYIANYYFFDVPMNLQPREQWFLLRVSVAAGCILTLCFYLSPLADRRFYKLPAVLMCMAVCYSQSIAVVWYGKEAWIFFFIFILVAAIILRMSSFSTVLFSVVTIAVSWPNMVEGGVLIPNLVSSALMVTVGASVLRATAVGDVRTFLLQKENENAQKTIQRINAEFLERSQSFIPKVIGRRLSELVNEKRMSVVEASIEALKARRCDVACMYTDIRGYTEASKELDAFINDSVMPEVAACSAKIEDYQGIPRKIGDLIFAYFDSESLHLNLTRCIAAGMDIARINESMNATSSAVAIRRYILISSGEAMVGNFGNLDSSIEITALGQPVNLLSRIDDLTKEPKIARILDHGDLIIDQQTHDELARLKSPLHEDKIDLDELGLTIRDFPEERTLYRVAPSDNNYELVLQMNEAVTSAFDKIPKSAI